LCRAAFTHFATLAAAAAKLTARCIACSKYKELVDKVHAALKTAIKEAQTDTAHGMPLVSEILSAVTQKGHAMSNICLCFLDGSLEGCMHLVDQLLVLTAGNTSSSKLGNLQAARPN
jgi:hydroxymethylpyrimidine pyrophosphatase-like HAD family hydrolase